MASEFKHLEFLPLDEENLVTSSDPEVNLKSKSCLNLGFIAANNLSRYKKLVRTDLVSDTNNGTFLNLSYALEAVLINLININSFSNPQHTEITEHYRRRQVSIASNKILPSFLYCQDLTFTGFKPWGGLYGTLGYYINLLEDYEEYYTPSEVSYYASRSLVDYSKSVAYNAYINKAATDYLLLSEFFETVKQVNDDSSLEADRKLYDLSKNIILASPLVKEIYAELVFYTEWLPKVTSWLIQIQSKGESREIDPNPQTNAQRAKNTLLEVISALSSNGFTELPKNTPAKYIKQSIPFNVYDLLEELSIVRVKSTYVVQDQTAAPTDAELLVIELLTSISQFRQAIDYRKSSNIILETFGPPGGYAMFLIMLATQLINRAYIVTYKRRNSSENMFTSDDYKRALKLIGYAGILLIKTSVTHVQLVGINILKTFRIYLSDIDPNNLLDI